jgi:hypothetical protein
MIIISMLLSNKSPHCFSHQVFGRDNQQPGGIRRYFDKPPPRQLSRFRPFT